MNEDMLNQNDSYWLMIWKRFYRKTLGKISLGVVLLFSLVAIYAPFLASGKPFIVHYEGEWFFPLFRYLFYTGYYTKNLDIFFNLLIFTFPLVLIGLFVFSQRAKLVLTVILLFLFFQLGLFIFIAYGPSKDPAFDPLLNQLKQQALMKKPLRDWNFEQAYLSKYAKLNLLLKYQQKLVQQQQLEKYSQRYEASQNSPMPTLLQIDKDNEEREAIRLQTIISNYPETSENFQQAKISLSYLLERQQWLETQQSALHYEILPFFRYFHWQEDAAGSQSLNQFVSIKNLTRTNHKDLMAALLFGVRISLVVGFLAVFIAVLIGVPIGAAAGYYGGKFDMIVSRILEVWEAMPTFFMLLMVVAILQSKSIFLVITIIGIFGWTTFSRYIRGEFFKQRNLPYIEACHAIGLPDSKIIFSHILPNAIPPILTLLPFAIMGAITTEAGLSFLGLGEEGSCSWGVLMDEGRTAFPGESYLLWPPAALLTLLLVAIAIVGDTFRDAMDPKS